MGAQQSATSTVKEGAAGGWPVRVLLVFGGALGLGIAFDALLYGKLPGISFPLYIIAVLGILLGLARILKVRLPKEATALMVPLLFFTAMVAIRANELLTFLNIVASLYLLALLAYVVYRPRIPMYRSVQYLSMPLYVMAALGDRWGQVWQEAAVVRRLAKKHPAVPQVLRGIFIAVPILFLFGALFASADLVFRKYVGDLFDVQFDLNVVMRLFWIVAIASIALVWLAHMLQLGGSKRTDSDQSDVSESGVTKRFGSIEVMIVFGSLNVLFLCFLGVQLTYMFGGEQNIAGQGFTYAEYARKGFFELIAVAAISVLVLLVAEKFTKHSTAKQRLYFKVLAGLLIAQVLVVMLSAFQRLSLYESAYGFTALRLYSHLFIVWLAVVLALLGYKIVRDKPEQLFAFGTFVSVLAFLALVNLINVDAFVARKNIERYHATGKLDPYYLGNLSADAVPQVARLLDPKVDTTKRSIIASQLLDARRDLQRADRHWQSANLARTEAREALSQQLKHVRPPIEDAKYYHRDSAQ